MSQCMRFALGILLFLFYVLTVALTCDVGIEVEYEGQEKYCAMNQSTINITVATPNIDLECPSGYNISLTPASQSVQTEKNTILNGGHLSIQVLRYGHTGEYDCVSSQSDRKISIWIQAIGVGMIIRDRTNNGVIEFHQVLNNSVVYLSCEKDFGILFICESSYQNMRFPLLSSGTFTPNTQPANTNEFEIASDGVLNGDETVLTCEPKDELGIVQEIVVTVKVTERIPEEDCEGIFPRTSTPNSEDTACVLELGISAPPVIPCIDCSADWDKMDGVCYRVLTSNSNWDDAQANCESFGGHLAEVPNYYVNKIVASKANGQQCWIGLRRDDNGGYEWRSERKVNEDEFSAWKDGDIGSGSGDCGFMSTSIGEWELKPCNDIIQCSVCMKGTISPPPLSRPQENCEGGVVIANRCYQLFTTSLPWKFAQFECELLGSNLIEIPDQNISNLVTDELSPPGEYWTGLRREDGAADFTWRSGRELEDGFDSWKDGYPGSMHGCVSTNQDLMWQVKPCNDRLGYLCQNGTFNIISQQTQAMQTTETTVQPTTTLQIATSSFVSTTSQKPESTATTTAPTVPVSENQIKPMDCNEDMVIFLEDKCTTLQEHDDDITDVDMMIFGDYSEEVERVLLVLITDLSLNSSEAIRIEINGTTVVLANLPTGDNASINITSSISISTDPDSFASDTTLAALVMSSSDSEEILQTLTDSTMMFISDICILVSDNELSGTISLVFTYNTALFGDEDITCNFYNNVTSVWSSEGIETVRSGDVIECVTNHFTSFALLVTFEKNNSTADEMERTIQGYLSMGLCIASLIFLVTSLILYACVGKKFFLRDLNIIHLNYILALILALVSFLVYSVLFAAKIEIMPFSIGCKAIAFLNHYFWLSVFSWNFCEALHIILALYSYKLSNARHYWWLIIVGWGFPVPIVVITLGVAYDYYTNMEDNICFLNRDRGVILAFLVPIYFLILVNTGILIFVVVVTIYVQRKRTFKKYICSLLCGTATTLPLLGLPWVAGILPNLSGLLRNDSIAWLSYVFVVVNASQGILFFCIHVIRNDQVLEKLCKLSPPDTNEEVEKNSQNKDINNGTNGNGHKKISKGMRTPNDFSNTTEAGNYLTKDSSTFLTQRIADLPSDIAIENPTFKNSY